MNDGDGGVATTGLTLGGILSIKQTPPYRLSDRTLLDLIRDDHHQPYGNEHKLTWKMLRKKFRFKLVGTGCHTAVPTLASHVTVTVNADSGNGAVSSTTLRSHLNLPVSNEGSVEITAAREGEEEARGGGEGGEAVEPASTARMSLMSLLEVDGSSYAEGDGDDVAEEVVTTEVDENEKYNNCCVCMVFTMKMEILLEPTSNKLMVEHAEYDESNTYVLERFNTTAGNPVKKILLKLNLSDHRLFKMVVEVPGSSCLTRSITTCSYPTDKHKVIMKAQVHVSRLPLL
ncbi:hypothetical protein Tco_1311700 [Tanacetum coccineum]